MKRMFSLLGAASLVIGIASGAAAAPVPVARVIAGTVAVCIDDCTVPGVPTYVVDLSYIDIAAECGDDAPVILFIHGNSASKEFFGKLLQEPFMRDFRCIAVDLPGHGNSSSYPNVLKDFFCADEERMVTHKNHFYSFSGYAHILNKFLAVLGINARMVNLFGWSLGGHVAIEMMRENPAFAHVMLTGTPINNGDAAVAGFEPLKQLRLATFVPDHTFADREITVFDLLSYRQQFTTEQAQLFHGLGGVTGARFTDAAGICTDPEARYFMIKALGTYDQEAVVRRDGAKFSVIQGANDQIKIKEDAVVRVQALGVKITELSDVGHAVFYEKPDAVAHELWSTCVDVV